MAAGALHITDLIPDWPAFLRDHWNQRPYSRALGKELLECLLEGFKDGDTAELLGACRKADNARYTPEERDEMERDLETSGRTLNLPYCFSRGAQELEAAFVDACGERVNDIEVGLYISRTGGDVAEWHCDAVHNFTIQLRGSKEWQHLAATKPATADVTSRGLFDRARNRAEQLAEKDSLARAVPQGFTGTERFDLIAGSLLYLPPGHWHRVTPVVGNSLSIDVRLGHLSAGKWLCEAIYAQLGGGNRGSSSLHSLFGPDSGLMLPMGPMQVPDLYGAVGGAVGDLSAATLLRETLGFCPVPRPLPCEPAHSDGLNRGASIAWLAARGCLSSRSALISSDEVVISRMVAISFSVRDGTALVLRLLASSPLSAMDYLRFAVVCDSQLQPALARLIADGRAIVSCLTQLVPKTAPKTASLMVLLRCLVFANVLIVAPRPAESACSSGCGRSTEGLEAERRPAKRGRMGRRQHDAAEP